ncbi:alpha/beta hydrolase fold domain-containing protein [Flavobacterium sp. GA093]|uniref:Alpha/beta hydrolase fold domain-containing protein n=1 Tax=Flavobacterium hydrocarbonoxydans TaxID=2683249 RepID=A0A6I4NWC1_9FLAO|nr:alpha/beta hydrolase [Flavobacterium hydrocarbonoxydans]MWB95357.1 alpha/beta hydrolase fold domain-containing protein [Flavobacterium hydrocarbonoxydans]
MKKITFIISFILIGFSAVAQKTEYETKSNIQYYNTVVNKADSYINERCVLDIYYPKNSKNFATIVWFHGGGLTGGSKEIPEALKNKGFAIIGVNYRLSPKVKAEKCIEDAAAAVAWTFNNIANYGGDSSLIFVAGHSAGAYLTSMIGLDKKWLQKEGIDANKIAGLIPFSSQCITHFEIRRQNGIPEKQPTIDAFAPLFHVRADAPPLLLITGNRELEMLGRYEENAYMERMMKLVGHKQTQLFELDGYGHGMTEPAFPLLVNEVNRIIKEN